MRPWLSALAMGELVDRYCYYEEEPYGWEANNHWHGQVCATVAQVHGNKASPSDFYIKTAPEPEADVDDLAAFFRGMT